MCVFCSSFQMDKEVVSPGPGLGRFGCACEAIGDIHRSNCCSEPFSTFITTTASST